MVDIDECAKNNPCDANGICKNVAGSFSCSCKKGYRGDGTRDGNGCIAKNMFPVAKFSLGNLLTNISILLCFLISTIYYCIIVCSLCILGFTSPVLHSCIINKLTHRPKLDAYPSGNFKFSTHLHNILLSSSSSM